MWSRIELKERAKIILKKSYWKAFIVSIVLGLVTGSGGGGSGSNVNYKMDGSESFDSWSWFDFGNFLWIIGAVALLVVVFTLFRILLGTILEVGARKYFIQASGDEFNMGYLGFGFKSGRYLNIVLTMLYRGILLILWTLLLIIPGIIKGYAYRMVPFILADNPEISPTRAIELSKKMTDGQKFDMFVLDLSFIGWYILGMIACGIGVLFVAPYYQTTITELYIVLRDKSIKAGQTSNSELNVIETAKDENEDEFAQYYVHEESDLERLEDEKESDLENFDDDDWR